jgi:hypothetical protein
MESLGWSWETETGDCSDDWLPEEWEMIVWEIQMGSKNS